MPYDNGSPPDDIAAAAGEVLTEIGAAPTENGGGTSATATASSLGETARVLLAPPSTPPDDLANAAGETSTGFGVGPDEHGDGTSADAPASPLAEAPPHEVRRAADREACAIFLINNGFNE